MRKQKLLRSKPDSSAVISTHKGKRIDNWPAFKSNNDRFKITVPCMTLDPQKDVANMTHVHITHQPTGKAAVLGVPFKMARKMSAVCYALFGDALTEDELMLRFATLPPEIQQYLRKNWTLSS